MNTYCGNCHIEITSGYLCTSCRKANRAAITAHAAPIIAESAAASSARREATVEALRHAASMGA